MPLTDVEIKKAKHSGVDNKPERLTDGGGMYLELSPTGGKWWRLKYRFAGKEKRISLGTYPEVSLKMAREKRDEAKLQLRDGVDPSEHRKETKRLTEYSYERSFEAVAREWLAHMSDTWSPIHRQKTTTALEKEAFQRLGKLPIDEIRPSQIIEVVREIEARGSLNMAKKVFQWTGAIFRFAMFTDRAKSDPTVACRGALKTRPVQHMARISEKELPALLAKISTYGGDLLTRMAMQFMALTFVRTTELIGAKWEEIDREKKEWRIPPTRMKMKTVHLVPLSKQSLELLDKIATLTSGSEYIFASPRCKQKHISNNTILYALYRMGYQSRMTGHGFRGLASTILNERGFRADVIERQLAHSERNEVRAAYNHAEYLAERREMMQFWADFLASCK